MYTYICIYIHIYIHYLTAVEAEKAEKAEAEAQRIRSALETAEVLAQVRVKG